MQPMSSSRVTRHRSRVLAGARWGACILLLGGLVGAATWQAVAAGSPPRVDPREAPHYDPAHFTTRVDNAWFPLKPGITYVYRGVEADGHLRDVFTVTRQTITIAGVECRVVHDEVFLDGVLADEDRRLLHPGRRRERLVLRRGHRRAGREGPGHQSRGHLADRSRRRRGGHLHGGGPAGRPHVSGRRCCAGSRRGLLPGAEPDEGGPGPLRSLRSQPDAPERAARRGVDALEPGVVDHKYYVRGIGEVREPTVRGPLETLGLVRIVQR